jgi:hypothetical protein
VLDYLKDPSLLSTLGLTDWIALLLWLALLVAKLVALVECVRYTSAQFVSAGKQTRQLWLVLTGLSLAFHLISGPLSFINIAGTIASTVFLVDVRPALRHVSGRGGGSGSYGPYGPY